MLAIQSFITRFRHLALVLILSAAGSATHAATLVTFPFTPGSGTISKQPTNVDPAVVVSNIQDSANHAGNFTVSTSSGTAFLRSNEAGASLSTALTDNDYIDFTLTPAAGQVINLTDFIFDHLVSTNATTSFTSNFSILASLNGFAVTPVAGDALGTSTQTSTTNTGGGNLVLATNVTYSLGDPQFQGLISAQTVTFRVYGFDNVNDTNLINRVDNIRIEGTVVPEPASALLLLGAAPLLIRRRRR